MNPPGGRAPVAVFLDRDGVLNRVVVRAGKPYPPGSVGEIEIPPDVGPALARLKTAGFRLVVVTNQPDVARGRQRRAVVEAINADLAARLPLDEFRVCYHDDGDGCLCRKPQPGLLLAPPTYHIARSVMVGDRWRDVEAGRRAGVRATVMIGDGYNEALPTEPDYRAGTLEEAARWILGLDAPDRGTRVAS